MDPVEQLIKTARGTPVEEEFRVTGVMVQYYFVCKRELWFESRDIEINRDNPNIARGTTVDESAYSEQRRNMHIGMISIDLLQDGRVIEVKPSSIQPEPSRMQLCYYLWYLKQIVDEEKEGVLAHPAERKREKVVLTEQREDKIEEAIRGIHDIITKNAPPPAERKPFCDACAYHDFCWC
jgi:CRISPR-associated exonuclease Cas4